MGPSVVPRSCLVSPVLHSPSLWLTCLEILPLPPERADMLTIWDHPLAGLRLENFRATQNGGTAAESMTALFPPLPRGPGPRAGSVQVPGRPFCPLAPILPGSQSTTQPLRRVSEAAFRAFPPRCVPHLSCWPFDAFLLFSVLLPAFKTCSRSAGVGRLVHVTRSGLSHSQRPSPEPRARDNLTARLPSVRTGSGMSQSWRWGLVACSPSRP